MASPNDYIKLITSEHNQKPNYVAMMSIYAQWAADAINLLQSFPSLFDIDVAVGDRLDKIGVWVGQSRVLNLPLSGVYFSLDTFGVGLDQGTWFVPGDPLSGLVTLPDDSYRLLLKAKIANNTWDGTVPGAYKVWDVVFALFGFKILIQDFQDMTMAFVLLAQNPSAVALALLVNGYLTLRPAGVGVKGYYVPSVPNAPLFGLDAENSTVSGLDVGAWATKIG